MINVTTRRARKQHRCYLCWRTIDKGTEYMYGAVPPPDGWHDYKAHIECNKAWGKIGHLYDWLFPGWVGDGDQFIERMQEVAG